MYSEDCQPFKNGTKVQVSSQKFFTPGVSQEGEGSGVCGTGYFDKHFVENSKKEVPQENILVLFLLDSLKPIININGMVRKK